MKIAVIDQDKWLHNTMTQYFLQFQIANDCDLSVEHLFSCEEAYRRILLGTDFDLLFLDVEFPEMCGIEFGMLLRRRLRNYDTQIVFLSSGTDCAPELFPVHPAGLLVKPFSYDQFAVCLSGLISDLAYTTEFLDYTLENTHRRIRVKEVLYLKAHGKKVAFHTREGSFSVYGKITDLIDECAEQFLCISRGEYANLRHVLSVEPHEIRLTDNIVLHISRGRLHAVRQRLAEL